MSKTSLTGQDVRDGGLTDVDIAAANKDGVKSLASMRTLSASTPEKIGAGATGTAQTASSSDHAHGADGTIEIGIDGGTAVPTTGVRVDFIVPFAMTITGWTIVADVSGDIQVDIWKDTYANFPPTIADTVTASDKPLLSGGQTGTGACTGWTTAWAAGACIRVNLDSVATIKRATIVLNYTRA